MFKKIAFPFLFTTGSSTQTQTQPQSPQLQLQLQEDAKKTKHEIVDIILHEYSSISWLFCLTKSNLIYGFILSSNSNSEHSDQTCYKAIEYSTCLQDAQLQLMHIPVDLSQTNTQLIKLNAMDAIESLSTNIILIVFTNCGDRLFLQLIHSPCSQGIAIARMACTINQEYSLKLSFIRLRPPFIQLPEDFRRLNRRHSQAQTPAIHIGSPRNVTQCYCRDGLTLYNSSKNLNNCLLLIARDDVDCKKSTAQLHESIESSKSSSNESSENDIAEIPQIQYVPQLAYLLYNRQQMQIGGKPFVGLTQFAVQHLVPARLFVTVSDLTLTRYKYLRIIDVLENILKQYNLQNQNQGVNQENPQQQLESFVAHYGAVETEVMLLTIACCRTPEEMHGIEENENVNDNVNVNDNENKLQICIRNRFTIAAQASTLFIQHLIPRFVAQQQQQHSNNYQRFGSSTIFAVYLWLSRMLRPIWCYTLVIPNLTQGKNANANKNLVRSRFTSNEIKCIMQPLSNGLKLLTQATNDWSNNHVYFNQQQRELHCTELIRLIECIKYCIQVLNVWSIVCYSESNFQFVFNLLANSDHTHAHAHAHANHNSQEQQTIFENIQFQGLVFTDQGKSLMKSIVVAIISKFDVQEARDLHHRCPLLFSSSDYLTFVASNEINEYARNMGSNNGGNNNGHTAYLEHALQKYKAAAKDNLIHFDLQTACRTLRDARFFVGVIDLALYVRELSEIGIASNTNTNTNANANTFIKKQTECEAQIFIVLSQLLDSSSSSSSNSNTMANENKFLFEKILVRLLKEKQQDMPFLFNLYQFFLEQNCVDKLFTKQVNFLVDFLCNPKDNQQQRNHKLPILIQFYSRTKQYRRLIKLIHALSQSAGFTLNQRYQFLDDARAASKCLRQDHSTSNSNGNDSSYNYNYNDDDQLNALDCEQYFEQAMKLCLIQIRVANKIQTIVNDSNNNTPVAASAAADSFNIQSQLLNVEPIYELCRQYNFFDYALDCLSFADDSSMGDISSSCWCALIGSGIQKYFDERRQVQQQENVGNGNGDGDSWMQYICRLIISQMKLYDLNKQPWIFDHYVITKELHTRNFELSQGVDADRANARCVVDLLLQSTVTLQEIINIYSQILNINHEFKPIEIVICCAYLLQQLLVKQNHSQSQSLNTDTIKQALVLCDECLFIFEKHSFGVEPNSQHSVLKNLEHFKRVFAYANNTTMQNQSRLTFF